MGKDVNKEINNKIMQAKNAFSSYQQKISRVFESKGIEDAKDPSAAAGKNIPKFDLAENIMAEQRKAASARRKAPAGSLQSEQEPFEIQAGQTDAVSFESQEEFSDSVIAEIVARDIKQMLGV